jgi:hypothetical protein
MSEEQLRVVAGFPDFWQVAYDKYPLFFKAAMDLLPLQNEIFRKPVSEPLHKVLRHITKIVSNSLGALIVLALNGYGNDAMKVARGMFEGAVIARYLRQYPEKLDDYMDWHWIRQKRRYEYMKKYNPELLQRISPEKVEEMQRQFDAVKGRFTDRRGNLRNSWCERSLRQMAEAVGMGPLYPSFYSIASSMHHLDFGGLSAQAEEETGDVDVAPSTRWLTQALIIGHGAVLRCLTQYNEVVHLGMDKECEGAGESFKRAWEK